MDEPENLIVLLPDAWHGAWAWQSVIERLADRGQSAIAFNPAAGQVHSLPAYAEAVVNFVKRLEADRIILGGHGMAGPVVQLAAEKLAGLKQPQLTGLIFFGAYVLKEGESLSANMPPPMVDYFRQIAADSPNNTVAMSEMPEFWLYNVINDDQSHSAEWLAKLAPAPFGPMEEAVNLPDFFSLGLPTAYISFNEDMTLPPGEFYPRMANRLPGHRHMMVNAGHEGPLTKPREVAEAILFLNRIFN